MKVSFPLLPNSHSGGTVARSAFQRNHLTPSRTKGDDMTKQSPDRPKANASLQSVDILTSDGKYHPGLVPVRDSGSEALSIDERVVVMEASSFELIDFVFFRRFSDGRSSQVAAYVVDNNDEQHNEQELAELHRQVWLQGKAPLLYIAWPGRIDILSCARGEDFWDRRNEHCRYKPAEQFTVDPITIAGEVNAALASFSLYHLADGTFWEEETHKPLVDHQKMAHNMLIQAVVETDKRFSDEQRPVLRRLLLLMVLIRYLEDRRVFPEHWFGRFCPGASAFLDVLRSYEPQKVYRVLEALETKFNGDVFCFPRNALTANDLRAFADLVEGKTHKQQRHLWTLFSFEHVPVEIISHLYQRFVQDGTVRSPEDGQEGGHGTVYTPPFLAALLLDQAMPYSQLSGGERILDPSCGSGVFLVGAFRRLVHLWRYQHQWERPDVVTLKAILQQSIFGVELESFAVDLTSFSLSLALCDALQPEVIWRKLKFARLRDVNLVQSDFFRVLLDTMHGQQAILQDGFDLIIGNPPFESGRLTDAGNEINEAAERGDKCRGKLPDKQVAYLFFEQAFSLLKNNGKLCLIQPSGFLYNNNTLAFRARLLHQHQVDTVLDFVSVRNLYDGGDTHTVAIAARRQAPTDEHGIRHWTFRRTNSVRERICFEIDYYDRHTVTQQSAEADGFVWRKNLLGGGRLHHLSERLRSLRSFGSYLDCQEHDHGWDWGEGYIAAKTGKRTPAPFLTGKPLLPTESFTDEGIGGKLDIVEETLFRSAYTEQRYTAPLILIKKLDSLPIAFRDTGFLAYRDRILGIHAPESQLDALLSVHRNLVSNRSTYRLMLALHGTEALVGQATSVRKQDVDLLPYPEDTDELSLSFWEETLRDDVINHMAEYVRLGQESSLLAKAAESADLSAYAEMFVQMLGSIYETLHAAAPFFLGGLICQPFFFGESSDLSWVTEQSEETLRALIYDDEQQRPLRTVRVLRYYADNVLLLIKPDRLRYWIRSTAIRDADDTLTDLYRWGY